MKFARFGPLGKERPALVDAQGRLRDASALVTDIDVGAIERLSDVVPETLPMVEAGVRIGIPFCGIGKFLAIGLNYKDHAAESGMPLPTEPIIFTKAISCLAGPNDDVPLPRGSTHSDWEIELGVVIGKRAKYVSEDEALDHVAGYVLVNDLSERFDQHQRGGSWDKGKGHDGFGPVGPWLVTRDELGDARGLPLKLDLNGKRMQDGNTEDMIFNVAQIIAYTSRFITLMPGDLIATGTPAGVGGGIKPQPVYLKAGDELKLSIDGLGEQRQCIVVGG
ncbi:MAG: fumarylacetoacetate hydrolase family protein [Sphingorhabdus sp.]|uniref:fumarylacetoacetate hydrolase family protein n=1 Tax=Sphingorhabdus sp. TaxID=1902408 RepID=UPI003CB9305F